MWTYRQSTGEFSSLAIGYSGNGEGRNNPVMESVPNEGPIPRGVYEISNLTLDHPKLGHYVLELVPFSDNDMFGRSGFFIHGDSREHPGLASDGCIVLPLFARETVWESNDHLLEVTD